MKAYKPVSDKEVARRLGVRSIHTAYYYLQTIREIYNAGLIICERLSTDETQDKNPLKGIEPKPIPTNKHTFKYQRNNK